MSNLLKSLQIKNLKLKNRLVMPPIATSKADPEGRVSQEILDYYDEKSKGGYISLIIVEHAYISKEGQYSERQLSVTDDTSIEGLKKLANVIHNNGSRAIMQINHAGSATNQELTGHQPVGPSAIPHPRRGNLARELSVEEIKIIIEQFKDAAVRVKKAGFDGVEIHGVHGFLLNQFLSPLTNKRTDAYGGDVFKRVRIYKEIIEAIINELGRDFPIFVRLSVTDHMEGGLTIEDSKLAAQELEKSGLAGLHVSGGFCGYTPPNSGEEGYFSAFSQAIKSVVALPVILTGGITRPSVAEDLLASGKADLIGVGRAIMNDSNWAKNTIEALK